MRLVGLDSWTVIFWRGLLPRPRHAGLHHPDRRASSSWKASRRPGWIAVLAYAANVLFFISAINATTVANTLVIASAAPLFAATLGWLFCESGPRKETWIAVLVVLVGLAIIFSGLAQHAAHPGRRTGARLCGIACGLFCGAAALRRTVTSPRSWRSAGSCPASSPGRSRRTLAVPAGDLWAVACAGLVVVPSATLLLSSGPQFIPASHVTLIMLLEIGLGPLWVWMVFFEVPAGATVLGGALVLATIVTHSRLVTRKSREQAARAAQG